MILQSRDYELLSWLVQMKFMLLDQIVKVFFKDCNPGRAPYRRLLKLMKAGLVDTRKVYTETRDLYVPTKQAVKLLKDQDRPYCLGLSKDVYFSDYEHDKTLIDLRILFTELGIRTWIPERVLRSVRPSGSCPDAALITPNYFYAVEYERTEKKSERYKAVAERYDRGNYHAVLYICRSQGLMTKLREGYLSSRRFYFITVETLLKEKENAVFFSSSDGLPVQYLILTSTDGELNDLPRDSLQTLLIPKRDQSFEARIPDIRVCKGMTETNVRNSGIDEFVNSEEEDAYWRDRPDRLDKHETLRKGGL